MGQAAHAQQPRCIPAPSLALLLPAGHKPRLCTLSSPKHVPIIASGLNLTALTWCLLWARRTANSCAQPSHGAVSWLSSRVPAGRMHDNEPLMRVLSGLSVLNSPNLVLLMGSSLYLLHVYRAHAGQQA